MSAIRDAETCLLHQTGARCFVNEIDYDDLKQKLRDAILAVIQERADELGISYDECIDRYFPSASNDQHRDSRLH